MSELKFVKSERQIYAGSKVVDYSLGAFKISASRQGVTLEGSSPLIKTEEELDQFAKVVTSAWQHYQQLRKNLDGL